MKKVTPNDTLNEAIALLEIKSAAQLVDLKTQFHITYESLRPVNLIKNTLKEATASPTLKNGISSAAIGMASGYIVKNLLFRSSLNPIKIAAGLVMQTLATNLASKNSDTIKSGGQKLVHALMARFMPRKREF